MATVHPKKSPLNELTAGEIMQPSVITVSRRAPIQEVEQLFTDHRISGCPVTDETGHVIGVISVRDLVERYAQGAGHRGEGGFYDAPTWDLDDEYGARTTPADSEDTVADLMNSEVFAVDRLTTVPEIARSMMKHSVHRLLVKDRGKFIGLISTTDILRAVAAL